MSNHLQNTSKRIEAIDALRAFVLFGIIIVHSCNLFGYASWGDVHPEGAEIFTKVSDTLLLNRMSLLFNVMFGCSFWFLLRKPDYPAAKFIWRCILLIMLGICAKLIYTSDVLMPYGICGIALVTFRKNRIRTLFCWYIIMLILAAASKTMHLGEFIRESHEYTRYTASSTMGSIVCYPLIDTIKFQLSYYLESGHFFIIMGNMILGYMLGKSGVLTHISDYGKWKWVMIFGIPYLVLLFLPLHSLIPGRENIIQSIYLIRNPLGGCTYATFFLWVYNKAPRMWQWACSYGKLGLTNYLFQGIFGITLLTTILLPDGLPQWIITAALVGVYLLQAIFSVVWLRHHRFGPMEYLWRKATDLYNRIFPVRC